MQSSKSARNIDNNVPLKLGKKIIRERRQMYTDGERERLKLRQRNERKAVVYI